MMTYRSFTALRKIMIVLACIAITAGCASIEKQSKPSVVPNKLKGYLTSDTVPNSGAFIPPPPAAGSTALALDQDISRNSLTLRDSPRWMLAAEDADLKFPAAAATFSCALNAPITEQDTPHPCRRGPCFFQGEENIHARSTIRCQQGAYLLTER
jgi:acid phosphatase (class A)